MAKVKITSLTELADNSIANGDLIPIVDVSDTSQAASGTTKKVTITSLASAVAIAFSADSPTFVNLNTTGTTTLGDSADATTVNGTLGVTGNATFDTNVLFVDAANDKVGIGTVSPGTKLSVNGTISVGASELPIQETNFGFGSGYKVLRLGTMGGARSLALNVDALAVVGGNFSGAGQILIGNASILAPDNAGTNWIGVLRATAGKVYLGGGLSSGEVDGTGLVVSSGNVGIGRTPTTYALEVNGDASKTSSGTWSANSDERLKTNIELADLKKCTDILKSIPLKRFTWRDDSLTIEQARDRSKLGWIAQEVKQYLPKAVIEQSFSKIKVEDGFEEIEEDVFIETETEIEKKEIKLVDGKYKEVITKEIKKNKEQVFDEFDLFDEAGGVIGKHKVAKKQKVTKPKFKQDVIEDCLSLNADQIYAAMYGAVQLLIQKVEALEAK